MHWETVEPAVVGPDTDTQSSDATRAAPVNRPVDLDSSRERRPRISTMPSSGQGAQSWSNGKVGVMGISYFAMNAWRVAALQPPHLAAIVPWEGAVDLYRDANRHGGIYSSGFMRAWGGHVRRYQTRRWRRRSRPMPPETYGEMYARNNPDLDDIRVPLLSAGNWAAPVCICAAMSRASSRPVPSSSILQMHVGDHVVPFYSLEGRLVQLRFLEQFLRGVDTGIPREPPIRLAIRYGGDRYRWRYESEWPHRAHAVDRAMARRRKRYAIVAATRIDDFGARYDAAPDAAKTSAAFRHRAGGARDGSNRPRQTQALGLLEHR